MIWKITIIIFLIMLCKGAIFYERGVTPELMENASELLHYDYLNFTFQEEGNNNNHTFLTRAIMKYVDFIGFSMVEGSRTAFRYGYKNPQYNFRLAYRLMMVTIFIILIKPLIFVIMGIYYLVVWIKKKKKK